MLVTGGLALLRIKGDNKGMKRKSSKNLLPKKLKLSKKGKWLGVCQGIADYYKQDVFLIRMAFGLITILGGVVPGFVLYFVAAWLMSENR